MTFRFAALLALSIPALLTALPAQAQAPDFGADTSVWANDGECDDPRFSGPGASGLAVDENLMADATDCQAAFQAGTVQLAQAQGQAPAAPAPGAKGAPAAPAAPAATATPEAPAAPAAPGAKGAPAAAPAQPAASAQVNFGDDSSQWPNDGECDDRRFAGQGMAGSLGWAGTGRDASDCRALYDAGSIRLWIASEAQAATQCAAINFGDDASQFANNGECDDPRFEGLGVSSVVTPAELGHDAADCSQLCAYGAASLRDY